MAAETATKAVQFVPAGELDAAAFKALVALEAASYPADEMASAEALEFRRDKAGDLFWVARGAAGDLLGFVNGTRTADGALGEESMHAHDPDGATVCVHSVVVAPEHRRQGLAREMLLQYLRRVCDLAPRVEDVVLLAKEHLVPFYESCGFANNGLSSVAHGQDAWTELRLRPHALKVACPNAFADPHRRFSGNPAAVCVMPFRGSRSLNQPALPWRFEGSPTAAECAEEWMRNLAGQMNLSETAFLRNLGPDDAPGTHRFELRWLTPVSEVNLCGHATLASAFALWDREAALAGDAAVLKATRFVFESRSGELFASRQEDGRVALDFPLNKSTALEGPDAAQVLTALGLAADEVEFLGINSMDVMVHMRNAAKLRSLTPDFTAVAAVEKRAVCVTAAGDSSDFDFISRFFGPRVGVNEDPFTGSAHTYLAPYWAGVLGKQSLRAFQASKRGGSATVNVDVARGRVELIGAAELAWCGEVRSSPVLALDLQ